MRLSTLSTLSNPSDFEPQDSEPRRVRIFGPPGCGKTTHLSRQIGNASKKFGPDIRITSAEGFSINPSLGWNGVHFLLAWQDDRAKPIASARMNYLIVRD